MPAILIYFTLYTPYYVYVRRIPGAALGAFKRDCPLLCPPGLWRGTRGIQKRLPLARSAEFRLELHQVEVVEEGAKIMARHSGKRDRISPRTTGTFSEPCAFIQDKTKIKNRDVFGHDKECQVARHTQTKMKHNSRMQASREYGHTTFNR